MIYNNTTQCREVVRQCLGREGLGHQIMNGGHVCISSHRLTSRTQPGRWHIEQTLHSPSWKEDNTCRMGCQHSRLQDTTTRRNAIFSLSMWTAHRRDRVRAVLSKKEMDTAWSWGNGIQTQQQQIDGHANCEQGNIVSTANQQCSSSNGCMYRESTWFGWIETHSRYRQDIASKEA